MYNFEDYFDIRKKKKPYEAPCDDLKDHLQALDMLIEVGEREIASYIAAPPLERPEELRAVNVAKDMKKALEHIRSREDESIKKGIKMPVRNIADEFSLDVAELFIILMAAALRYDLKYLRMYNYIADIDTGASLNAGVADALLNFFLTLPGTKIEDCLDPAGKRILIRLQSLNSISGSMTKHIIICWGQKKMP